MSKRFSGILAVGSSKEEAGQQYLNIATGVKAQMAVSGDDAYAVSESSNLRDQQGRALVLDTSLNPKFASLSGKDALTAKLTACLDGCGKFIVSDADLNKCPSCSATLDNVTDARLASYVMDDEVPHTVGGLVSTAATVEEAMLNFNSGSIISCSSEFSTFGSRQDSNFDPYSGMYVTKRKVQSQSSTVTHNKHHVFYCTAECANGVTVASDTDVVFCSHCGNTLVESGGKSEMPKIGAISSKIVISGKSVGAAVESFRKTVSGERDEILTQRTKVGSFSATCTMKFDPFDGSKVVGQARESLNSVNSNEFEGFEAHAFGCVANCDRPFVISTSCDAAFCPHCSAPLEELNETHIAGLSGVQVAVSSDFEDDLEDLDNEEWDDEDDTDMDEDIESLSDDEDLEEDYDDLDEEDLGDDESAEDLESESSVEDEEFEQDYSTEDVQSLSGDDCEEEECEDDASEEDTEDEDLDLEDDEEIEEESESSDDSSEEEVEDDASAEDEEDTEDEDLDLEDDEESDQEESESACESISMLEAVSSVSTLDPTSISLSFSQGLEPRWHLFYDGTPVAYANITSVASAFGDEAKARKLFSNPQFAHAVSVSCKERGIDETISEFGFKSHSFQIQVGSVLRNRLQKQADAKVEQVQSEIESVSADYKDRFGAALGISLNGLTTKFWRNANNPVAESLINSLSAAGIADARPLVERSFIEHGESLFANAMERADDLMSKSSQTQEEIAHAISEFNPATTANKSVSSVTEPVASTSSNSADDFAARAAALLAI